MYLILLSGGSGKRLWPLSNDVRSKQFLKVLPSEEDPDVKISMLQRIWGQLQEAGMTERTIISTCNAQVDMIRSQLSEDVPLIIEPERRDTYAAIALASAYLYDVRKVSVDETVIVLPVDMYVSEEFYTLLKSLPLIRQEANSNLLLIGIPPTEPSEKYGYIVPSEGGTSFQLVDYFVEKPQEEKAKLLINKGAKWNAGVFTFKLGFLVNHLEEQQVVVSYEKMRETYRTLRKNSFDYEVVEKTTGIAVTTYDGTWKELGVWDSLTEEMKSPVIGKGKTSHDCENVHIVNELAIPVSVLGLSNIIVAVSPDGILVSDRNASARVKEMLDSKKQRPMYEERRWGSYRVLDYTKNEDGYEVLTKRVIVEADKNISYQIHHKRSEVWTVIGGNGLLALDGIIQEVNAGDVFLIPLGVAHGLKAVTELEFIEVQRGTELSEEDITRLLLTWDEIQLHMIESKKRTKGD